MTESESVSQPSLAGRVFALVHFCHVSPRLFEALLRRFKTVDNIYRADAEEFLEIEGVDEEQADRLRQAGDFLDEAEVMVEALDQREIEVITRFDPAYGKLLFELNNPPPLIFCRGKTPDPNTRSLAVVGTRKASSEGIGVTSQLVKEVAAEGVQIVSSLVGGIDLTAHLAAKSAGGKSFAVLNCGFDQIERTEKLPVAIDIVENGGVISEYAPDVEYVEGGEIESHRLIIGFAQAVVVVEAYAESERVLDILRACRDIGKLVFFMVDPEHGALADETSLVEAVNCGAIPIEGFDHVGEIVNALV